MALPVPLTPNDVADLELSLAVPPWLDRSVSGRPGSGAFLGTTRQCRLHAALDRVAAGLEGCDHASVAALEVTRELPRVSETVVVATDAVAARADELQQSCGEGPTLHMTLTGYGVTSHDLRTESRWPRWCKRVVSELSLASVLTVPLRSGERQLGVLTLYSRVSGAVSDLNFTSMHSLAEPIAALLVEAHVGRGQGSAR